MTDNAPPKKSKQVTLNFRLDEEIWKTLNNTATANCRSMNLEAKKIITDTIKQQLTAPCK